MSAQCIVVLVSVQILLYELPCLAFHMSLLVNIINQGPRRNFEIGGGGGGAPLVTQYWGGHKTLFLTKSL